METETRIAAIKKALAILEAENDPKNEEIIAYYKLRLIEETETPMEWFYRHLQKDKV